jgi:hypothetical protein
MKKQIMLNFTCKLFYYNDEAEPYWVARCDELNIEVTSDTIKEASSDLVETIQEVIRSMSEKELKAYGIAKVQKSIKIGVKYKIPSQEINQINQQISFC